MNTLLHGATCVEHISNVYHCQASVKTISVTIRRKSKKFDNNDDYGESVEEGVQTSTYTCTCYLPAHLLDDTNNSNS